MLAAAAAVKLLSKLVVAKVQQTVLKSHQITFVDLAIWTGSRFDGVHFISVTVWSVKLANIDHDVCKPIGQEALLGIPGLLSCVWTQSLIDGSSETRFL